MKRFYYGLAAWVDAQVGLVIDYVEKSGLSENTILIFSADHGASLGEFGAVAKFLFNRASQRVPLIISLPGMQQGVQDNKVCSMVDFARTIFHLLDIEIPKQFKGRNLLEVIEGETFAFGTIGYGSAVSYPLQYDASGRYDENHAWPRRACVRTNRFRLDMNIRMNGRSVSEAEEDLFFVDRNLCPEESVNLAQSAQY
ncbi:MAG: sulfatase-like hydrolase/transferase [Lachnospiraceae bacterium]